MRRKEKEKNYGIYRSDPKQIFLQKLSRGADREGAAGCDT
jgi:hypothetical protein